MAEKSLLEEIWRQSLELNLRYYAAVASLATSYYKDLATIFTNFQDSQFKPVAHLAYPPVPPRAAQVTVESSQQAGVMVLEAETGGQALGVFLVANNIGQEVSARVVASAFTDPDGNTVQPSFMFDPEVIVLAPSEQLLVRVTTEIDNSLEPEVRYSGEFAVPELAGTRIPIILRRRSNADESGEDTELTVVDTPQKTKSSSESHASDGNNPEIASDKSE